MIREIDLFGIYVPPMFAYAMAAGIIWLVLRQCLRWTGAYRFVWHPALFNTALYVLVLSLCVTFVLR
jgi:hypothetical protein